MGLDPAEKGHRGQIIRMWHNDAERTLETILIESWITEYKTKFIERKLVYSEDFFGIVNKEDI